MKFYLKFILVAGYHSEEDLKLFSLNVCSWIVPSEQERVLSPLSQYFHTQHSSLLLSVSQYLCRGVNTGCRWDYK